MIIYIIVLKSTPDSFCTFPPDVFAFPLCDWVALSVVLPVLALLSPAPRPYSFPHRICHAPYSRHLHAASHLQYISSVIYYIFPVIYIFPRLTYSIAMSPHFLPDESVIGIFVYSTVIQ